MRYNEYTALRSYAPLWLVILVDMTAICIAAIIVLTL